MVKVWLEANYTEIPIADIVAKGLPRLYSDISATHKDLKNLTDFDGFCKLSDSLIFNFIKFRSAIWRERNRREGSQEHHRPRRGESDSTQTRRES